MQNIDFRSQLSHHPVGASSAASERRPASRQNRRLSFVFAAIVLFFTIGLFAGIKIGKLQKIERSDCIVRYPDEEKGTRAASSATPSFSSGMASDKTRLSNTGSDKNVNYIIKVGEFEAPAARRLSRQLNNLPEIRKLQPKECKDVEESEGRSLAFRMKVAPKSKREHVLVGCFHNAARASHILQVVKKSGLPGSSRAELYEY